MLKSIRFIFHELKYDRGSIGDDIRIEIAMLDKFLRVDKRIRTGQAVKIDQEIGQIFTDQKLFKTTLQTTAIEKDILFNDVGSLQESIEIDTQNTRPQRFTFTIHVKESRSIFGKVWGKSTADISITVEAKVLRAYWYVLDEGDGWLLAKLEENKKRIGLPAFLEVAIEREDAKREYFTIREGPYRGKRASTSLRRDGSSQFGSGVIHAPMARAVYSISQKMFILNGKHYQTVDYSALPWKKGLYDIEIPDYAHRGGAYYPEAKRAKTWFRIGHFGERYLHTGGRSLGCITVVETKRWTEIYNTLIRARKGDSMSVGILEIVD